jgi:hypothetical protein
LSERTPVACLFMLATSLIIIIFRSIPSRRYPEGNYTFYVVTCIDIFSSYPYSFFTSITI